MLDGGVAILTGEGVPRAGEAGAFSKVLTTPLPGSLMTMGLFLAEGITKCGFGGAGLFEERLVEWVCPGVAAPADG